MKSIFIVIAFLTLAAFKKTLLYEIQGNRILCQSNTEKLNHSESVRFLDLNSITVFSPKSCFDRNKPECTSLEQVNCVTICYIAKYKENSNCSCVITAGTEIGHPRVVKSHAEGFRVNIALSNCHNDYINKSFTRVQNRYNGSPQYLDSATVNIFGLGGNSYEVLVNQC